jgi:hypothetical protein
MKKLKIKNWTTASRIAISGNYMLRRPKRSKNEVVAPKEEEEEEFCARNFDAVHMRKNCNRRVSSAAMHVVYMLYVVLTICV